MYQGALSALFNIITIFNVLGLFSVVSSIDSSLSDAFICVSDLGKHTVSLWAKSLCVAETGFWGWGFDVSGTRRSSAPGGHLVGPGDILPSGT